MEQRRPYEEESGAKRFAQFSLIINKFVLSLPLIAVFFLLFPDNAIIARGTQKSVGMLLIGTGLLSYPLVFALSRTFAKQCFEKCAYRRSIYLSWMPVSGILLILLGYAIA